MTLHKIDAITLSPERSNDKTYDNNQQRPQTCNHVATDIFVKTHPTRDEDTCNNLFTLKPDNLEAALKSEIKPGTNNQVIHNFISLFKKLPEADREFIIPNVGYIVRSCTPFFYLLDDTITQFPEDQRVSRLKELTQLIGIINKESLIKIILGKTISSGLVNPKLPILDNFFLQCLTLHSYDHLDLLAKNTKNATIQLLKKHSKALDFKSNIQSITTHKSFYFALQEAFPANHSLNLFLHPLEVLNDETETSIITSLFRTYYQPEDALVKLSSYRKILQFNISVDGCGSIDEGGLSRQFIYQLFTGLTKHTSTIMLAQHQNKQYLPVFLHMEEGEKFTKSMHCFNAIGRLFVYSLEQLGEYPTGEIFHMSLFETLLMLNENEFDFESLKIKERMLELYKPLASQFELEVIDLLLIKSWSKLTDTQQSSARTAIKRILEIKCIQNLSVDINEQNFPDVQKLIFKSHKGTIKSKVLPIIAIAKSIKNKLPFEASLENQTIEIRSWDEFKNFSPIALSTAIQGVLSKEQFKQSIVVVEYHSSLINELDGFPANFEDESNLSAIDYLENWLHEWIDNQPDDLSTIKNLLIACTGTDRIIKKLYFNLSSNVDGLVAQTCSFEVEVPYAFNKEILFAELDQWGQGKGSQTFGSV